MAHNGELTVKRTTSWAPVTGVDPANLEDVAGELNALLADVFCLYLKTKNFHWHMSGPHFRDYHLLLDEHGDQLFSMTDVIAERVRKLGGTTIRSIGHIARLQRLPDNDAELVGPDTMLNELQENGRQLVLPMKALRSQCDNAGDPATASLLDNWIDESERRTLVPV
jgi:starvation-inducible DNA-binding protein